MAYTFLKAQGEPVGKSLVEEDKVDLARQLLQEAKNHKMKFLLPVDHVVAEQDRCQRASPDREPDSCQSDGAGYWPEDHRGLHQRDRPRPHNCVERTDGRLRGCSIRQRNVQNCACGSGKRRSNLDRRRRRLGLGGSRRGCGRQDYSHLHRRRSVTRISGGQELSLGWKRSPTRNESAGCHPELRSRREGPMHSKTPF